MSKRTKWIIAVIVLIIIVPVVAVLAIRAVNHYRYASDWDPDVRPDTYSGSLDGLEVEEIANGYARGFRLTPPDPADIPVVVFGGSEGGTNFELAAEIAHAGYDTYPTYFFSAEGQREDLTEVPIDEVLPPIDGPVILIGQSKGAELALNLAARNPDVVGVIALMPSDYSYQGLGSGMESVSSWTYEGDPVPFISFAPDDAESARNADLGVTARMLGQMLLGFPVRYREVYQSALDSTSPEGQEAARIRIEDSDADLLLVAGSDDGVWDSASAAQRIEERRPENTTVEIMPTGHVPGAPRFVPGMDLGGNEVPDPAAARALQLIVLGALEEWN